MKNKLKVTTALLNEMKPLRTIYPKIKEKDLQKQILEYLNLKGHYCWRNNSGAFKTERGGFYRMGMIGSPDIIGVAKNGCFIGIEVKINGNKPSVYQDDFIKQIKSRGGIGIVAYSLDDVINNGL